MTKREKISASKFYNGLVTRNYRVGYFSPMLKNRTGNYCFIYEPESEFSDFGLTLKGIIEDNNFEVLQNKNKFWAIYRG